MELDEGMLQWGLYAAAHRLPFLPTRAGLGSDVMKINPELRTVKSPYEDGEELVAMPALELDVGADPHEPRRRGRQRPVPRPDFFFDDLFCLAAKRRFMSCEKLVPTEDFSKEGSLHTLKINRTMVDGVIEAPGGATSPSVRPTTGATRPSRSEYAATAKDPDAWEAFKARYLDVASEPSTRRR